MPAVSVILPTYNREQLLGRAIRSVLAQSYQDFELIVVDDGSTDGTQKLARAFQSDKLIYMRHDDNRGVSAARNTGLQLARGDYIAFQDSDDEWLPHKLQKQMAVLAAAPPEVGIVCCGFWELINGNKKYVPSLEVRSKGGTVFHNLTTRFISTQLLLVKRGCFDKVGGFDERLLAREDWDLFLRLSRHYKFVGVNEPLVIRNPQKDSLSRDERRMTEAFKLLIEKYYDDIKCDRQLLAGCYFKLGHELCAQGDVAQGRTYLAKSITAHPLNMRASAAFLLCMLGRNVYGTVTRTYGAVRGWQ